MLIRTIVEVHTAAFMDRSLNMDYLKMTSTRLSIRLEVATVAFKSKDSETAVVIKLVR